MGFDFGVTTSNIHNLWFLGVILALSSSLVGALGDNIVRLSYVKESNRSNKVSRPLFKRPLWIFGEFLTLICNPILTLVSLKFAAASIVVPFGGLHIFWNLILCGYLLKEKLSKSEIAGSLIILFGIVFVVIFGTHQSPGYGINELYKLFKQTNFIFYSVLCLFCLTYLIFFSGIKWIQISKETFFRQGSKELTPHHNHFIEVISICAISGIFGGNGNLLAKSCIEGFTQEGFKAFFDPLFLILFLLTIIMCFLQAVSLTIALSRKEAKFVVPMANSILIGCGSIGGIILFREYNEKNPIEMVFFSIGICSVITGILILFLGMPNFNFIDSIIEEETSNLIEDSNSQILSNFESTAISNFSSIQEKEFVK